jgi:EAL domain-containing protein (putative c-di-GMP-specific phosphodiesterase class I)
MNQTKMQLYQLIYKSDASAALDIKLLNQFKRQIQESNYRKEVTGLLLFDGVHFLQVLEGRKTQLQRLYDAICNDPRHANVTLLLMEPIPAREFDQWSMQIVIRKAEDLTKIIDEVESLGELLKVGEAGETSSVIMSNYYYMKQGLGRSPNIVKSFLEGGWETTNYSGTSLGEKQRIQLTCSKSQLSQEYSHWFAFQPIVDTEKGVISAVEALMRGKEGQSPDELLNDLSESQMHKLDVESKRSAIAIFAEFGCDTTLSINLLPKSLISYPEIVGELRRLAESLSVEPSRITIEVTEQEAIENYDSFIDVVNQIRANGMRLAIDDFGAGYAGMSLLADFQPHKLKIDKKIVDGIASDGPRQAIVCAIMQFSFRLGIEVVAEGIETLQDFEWLKSVGVKQFQGYFFAKPGIMSIPDVIY